MIAMGNNDFSDNESNSVGRGNRPRKVEKKMARRTRWGCEERHAM